MERYERYKDSGVKWLGEIPSHWTIMPLKYSGRFCKGKLPSNTNDNCLGKPIIGASEMNGNMPSVYSEDNSVPQCTQNDILFLWDGANAGLVSSFHDGIVASTVTKFTCDNSNIVSTYLYYLEKNYQRYYKERVGGTTIPHMNSQYIASCPLLIPSIQEQQAIADYLDTATTKIDEAIAQQQKMIDLLNERKQIIINNAVTKGLNPDAPMKDSGVEWIGEIPEHWEIKKLKHVCQAFGRIGFRGYSTTDLVDEGEGCITLSPSNMRDGKMQYGRCTYLSWEKYEESPEIKVFNGDILFVKTGSTYGKSSIVEDLPLEATINPQLLVFKNFTCNNMFLANVLQSTAIKTQVEISVIGGTIPTISQQKILNYVFPFPTEDEQYAIVEYVESKSAPINSAIKAAEKQISLLQERKQIIINDVVTGKVKVS